MSGLRFELRQKDRFEYKITQLLAQRVMIASIDRFEHFIGFLEHERLQGIDSLLAVPRAAAGAAQRRHDLDQPGELSGGAVRFGHLIILVKCPSLLCRSPPSSCRLQAPRRFTLAI